MAYSAESSPEERATARFEGLVTALALVPNGGTPFDKRRTTVAEELTPVRGVLSLAFLRQARGEEQQPIVANETTADGLRRAASVGFLHEDGRDNKGMATYSLRVQS